MGIQELLGLLEEMENKELICINDLEGIEAWLREEQGFNDNPPEPWPPKQKDAK